jgi:hypothetical protein
MLNCIKEWASLCYDNNGYNDSYLSCTIQVANAVEHISAAKLSEYAISEECGINDNDCTRQ